MEISAQFEIEVEIEGYFEEFLDAHNFTFLGKRRLETFPGERIIGGAGLTYIDLKEPLHLVKGYKQTPVVVEPPRRVISIITMICGKRIKD